MANLEKMFPWRKFPAIIMVYALGAATLVWRYIRNYETPCPQNGLVNFEKRRKEFELLAQLTLYQKSAMDYSFSHQPQLVQWLRHSPVWPEKERQEGGGRGGGGQYPGCDVIMFTVYSY